MKEKQKYVLVTTLHALWLLHLLPGLTPAILHFAHFVYLRISYDFQARSQNCEKRLLASSCLSVCLSVRMQHIGSH
jgi:hypothetical protein